MATSDKRGGETRTRLRLYRCIRDNRAHVAARCRMGCGASSARMLRRIGEHPAMASYRPSGVDTEKIRHVRGIPGSRFTRISTTRSRPAVRKGEGSVSCNARLSLFLCLSISLSLSLSRVFQAIKMRYITSTEARDTGKRRVSRRIVIIKRDSKQGRPV